MKKRESVAFCACDRRDDADAERGADYAAAASTGTGNGRACTSSISPPAISTQLPQPLPRPVRIVSSDTVRTPASAARRISWSVTPWQMQTYKAVVPR